MTTGSLDHSVNSYVTVEEKKMQNAIDAMSEDVMVERQQEEIVLSDATISKFTCMEHVPTGEKFMRHTDLIMRANGKGLKHAQDVWTECVKENCGLVVVRDVRECADVQDWVFRCKRSQVNGGHRMILLSAEAATYVVERVLRRKDRDGVKDALLGIIEKWKGSRTMPRVSPASSDARSVAQQVVVNVTAALDKEFAGVLTHGVRGLKAACLENGTLIAEMTERIDEINDDVNAVVDRVVELARGVSGAEAVIEEVIGLKKRLLERKRKAAFTNLS